MQNNPPKHPKHLPAPDGIETFYEVRSRDSTLPPEEFRRLARHPIYIVLDNLRSAFNVGAIFRLADATRAAAVFTCGYTAHPPHRKLSQTALGTVNSVPWRHFSSTVEALLELKNQGVRIIGVETLSGAKPYHTITYQFPLAIILGNEALGVSQAALQHCDEFIEIPVFGYKNSLNVATAAAVILYEILRQGNWFNQPV
jgi:tRNA G18 (ribose-2'-O)-methylase SpoU|uniref:TrmH family RNA methyltransferase n=1 Tax=candidate division WOR-3 bacterium TaxID=2052148 RepID=A0A7V3PTH6_UNCW3